MRTFLGKGLRPSIFLSLIGLAFQPSLVHAKCSETKGNRPHGIEEAQLSDTTPLWDVGIPSTLSNLLGAAFILSDYRVPNTEPSTGKQIAGYISLGLNGFPWVFALLGECAGANPVEQVPMSSDERAEFRWGQIRGTYWLVGIDTALGVAMFLQADKSAARWVTGLSIPVPMIAALISRAKFERGPWRKEQAGAGLEVVPVMALGRSSGDYGIQVRYRF